MLGKSVRTSFFISLLTNDMIILKIHWSFDGNGKAYKDGGQFLYYSRKKVNSLTNTYSYKRSQILPTDYHYSQTKEQKNITTVLKI